MAFPVRIIADGSVNWLELVVQLATIATAVAAIVISIITYRSQVTHNKNSVKPILNVSCGDYVGEIFVKIKNKGVGPATVLSVKCENGMTETKHCECSLIRYFHNFDFLWTTFADDITGFTIAPGGEIVLLVAKSNNETTLQEIRKRLSNIVVTIEYTDIYGDKMKPSTRNLNWFGRTLVNKEPKQRP